MPLLHNNSPADSRKNCALYGKSMKFGTHISDPETCKFETSAMADFALGAWQ